MLKYCGCYVTFQEVPNEISLSFTITNCPHRCEGCHSPWLQSDIGDELTPEEILYRLKLYQGGVTCVCFMGVGKNVNALGRLVNYVHSLGLKVSVYTGDESEEAQRMLIDYFLDHEYYVPDYIKYGPYKKALGGLDHPSTNQRMLKYDQETCEFVDITSWFWEKASHQKLE